MRIFQYYLPVFFWCWQKVQDWHASHQGAAPRPLIIGMQAVQGCGKTTLVTELENLFAKVGVKSASISIDDFYLPFEGPAGTHSGDVPLFQAVYNEERQ